LWSSTIEKELLLMHFIRGQKDNGSLGNYKNAMVKQSKGD
jgi:hypothetical protein